MCRALRTARARGRPWRADARLRTKSVRSVPQHPVQRCLCRFVSGQRPHLYPFPSLSLHHRLVEVVL